MSLVVSSDAVVFFLVVGIADDFDVCTLFRQNDAIRVVLVNDVQKPFAQRGFWGHGVGIGIVVVEGEELVLGTTLMPFVQPESYEAVPVLALPVAAFRVVTALEQPPATDISILLLLPMYQELLQYYPLYLHFFGVQLLHISLTFN